jgi:recombination associated protein RdgC
MDVLERVRQTALLGKDFLVWLWFKSEMEDRHFDLGKLGIVELWFDAKIILSMENDQGTETVTCIAPNHHFKEARFALSQNKKISEATIRMRLGDDEWSFTVDATWFNFKSFKGPKVIEDKNEDPEGLFYEKMLLMEKPVVLMNALFRTYILNRLSTAWDSQERPALEQWIREGGYR